MSDRSQPPSMPPRDLRPRKRLSVLRALAATLGVIIMLLSGGCVLALAAFNGPFNMSDLALVLPYAGPPFLIGLGIWWLAVKVGRD